jgi:hypothetical protein
MTSNQGLKDSPEAGFLPNIKLYNWTALKVILPLLVLFLIYPLCGFTLDLDHPFQRAFQHGDLLVFSALILVEAAFELESSNLRDSGIHLVQLIAMMLAIFSIFTFVAVKFDVLRNEEAAHLNLIQNYWLKMGVYACLGWCTAILSGVATVYAIVYASYREASYKLLEISQS